MALNKYMHPRNIYKTKKPDFKELALKYPEFKKHVFTDLKGKAFIDFKNASSLRQLTISLLREDFGLDVVLPQEGLVPTIPLRLNYIHWIEDILQDCKEGKIYGIDIGPGASCVYPLVGCKLNPSWTFLAVEKCDTNLAYSEKNISANNMEGRIQVKKQVEDGILSGVLSEADTTYDFCMCNPPFFADHLEAQGIVSSRSDDRKEPSSVSTATPAESITEGGEVTFIKRIIQESLELQKKVRVYTSMVGKKTSLPKLKEELRKLKIPNFSTTEFCQGKTMRWGIAWTFDTTVIFPKSLFQSTHKEKPPLQYILPPEFVSDLDLQAIAKQIYLILHEELKIKCDSSKQGKNCISFDLTATENTWSNQRRKRRAKRRQEEGKMSTKDDRDSEKTEVDREISSEGIPENVGDNDDLKVEGEKSVKRKYAYQSFDLDDSGMLESKRLYKIADSKESEIDTTEVDNEKIFQNEDVEAGDTNDGSKKTIKRKHQSFDPDDSGISECKRLRPGSDAKDNHGTATEKSVKKDSKKSSEKVLDKKDDQTDFTFVTIPSTSREAVPGSSEGTVKPSCSGSSDSLAGTSASSPIVIADDSCHSDMYSNEEYILKFKLNVKKADNFLLELIWVDGLNRELMHQVLQYLKNKMKSNNNDQAGAKAVK